MIEMDMGMAVDIDMVADFPAVFFIFVTFGFVIQMKIKLSRAVNY